MQTYKDYRPTKFDTAGLNADENDISDFLVVLGRNRDSSILEETNFEAALEMLGGESETVQIHRFGHWACGWFELLLIAPSLEAQGLEIERKIDSYPLLAEDAYYENCRTERDKYWSNCSLRERVAMCRESGISIFSARLDYCPDNERTGESLLESIC